MSNPQSVSTWTLSEQLTLAGALTTLGCIAEALVARRTGVATSISTAGGDGGGIVTMTLLTTLEAINSLLAYINDNNTVSVNSTSIEAPSGESKSATSTHTTTPTEKTQRQGLLYLFNFYLP